jgi:hypothetical protein
LAHQVRQSRKLQFFIERGYQRIVGEHLRRAWTLTSVHRSSVRCRHAVRTRRPAGIHVRRSRRTTRRASSRAAPSSDDSSSADPPLVAPSLRRDAEPLWFDAASVPFCATAAELRRTAAWLRSPAVHSPRTKRECAPWTPSPRCTLKLSLTDFAPVTSRRCMNHLIHRRVT